MNSKNLKLRYPASGPPAARVELPASIKGANARHEIEGARLKRSFRPSSARPTTDPVMEVLRLSERMYLKPGISGGEKGGPLHTVVRRLPISPSPNAGDQALRHRHILLVVLPEFLTHHPLLGSDAEAYEEGHRDAGGQARHVVGENERLAHRI